MWQQFWENIKMDQNIEQILGAKGVKPTAMRNLVLDLLLKQKTAVSLAEMEKELSPVDRITVYRTLKTFEEHGLVHSVEDGTGATKFALCDTSCMSTSHQDLHIHFHCIRCKSTVCLPAVSIPLISLPDKYQSLETELLVKGVCPDCAG